MQVNRRERVAKAQGLGIIGMMALAAMVIQVWPRHEAARVVPRVHTPSGQGRPTPAAAPARPAGREPHERTARPAPATPAAAPSAASRRRLVQTVPMTSALRPALRVESFAHSSAVHMSPPAAGRLSTLPGTSIAISASRPAAASERKSAGGVTRGMQATGRSLTLAFRKTGAAVRRAF